MAAGIGHEDQMICQYFNDNAGTYPWGSTQGIEVCMISDFPAILRQNGPWSYS